MTRITVKYSRTTIVPIGAVLQYVTKRYVIGNLYLRLSKAVTHAVMGRSGSHHEWKRIEADGCAEESVDTSRILIHTLYNSLQLIYREVLNHTAARTFERSRKNSIRLTVF